MALYPVLMKSGRARKNSKRLVRNTENRTDMGMNWGHMEFLEGRARGIKGRFIDVRCAYTYALCDDD